MNNQTTKKGGEPLFLTGRLVATPGVLELWSIEDIFDLLNRHIRGDWGGLCEEDKRLNEDALIDGTRLFSSYDTRHGTLWVVTDAENKDGERLTTMVATPFEY